MTRRERVIKAILHKNTDFTPYQIDFTKKEKEKVAAYLKDESFYEKIGNHIEFTAFNGFLEDIDYEEPGNPGYYIDEFGVRWNRSGTQKDIGVIEDFIIKEPDIGKIKLPEIKKDMLNNQFKRLINNGRDTFKGGAIGFSLFERAWTLRGMENILMDMLTNPTFAEALFDRICELNLEIIDLSLTYDIDWFYFGDDWGQQSGMIMGPELWRRFIKPRMKRMFERVKSKGKYVMLHSCGDIHEIFPDLIDIGLDIYNTFQPEIYNIEKIKKEYGQYLTFWGGISTQNLLPYATCDIVKKVAIETIRILGKNGGYIAAPTHDIPDDVPPENVVTLIEVLKNQDKYI